MFSETARRTIKMSFILKLFHSIQARYLQVHKRAHSEITFPFAACLQNIAGSANILNYYDWLKLQCEQFFNFQQLLFFAWGVSEICLFLTKHDVTAFHCASLLKISEWKLHCLISANNKGKSIWNVLYCVLATRNREMCSLLLVKHCATPCTFVYCVFMTQPAKL